MFKRIFDFSLSLLALVVLFPLMTFIAILVFFKLGQPIFFTQERPGKDTKLFKMIKFRTMTDLTDKTGKPLADSERITPFGRLLRRTSLDELPELVNILKGDMSFVGPRPLLQRYLAFYTPEESTRHRVRPGLTGLAQISGRNAISWEEKLKLDVDYVKNMSFILDLKILLKTFGKVLFREDILDLAPQGPLDEYRSSIVIRDSHEDTTDRPN